MTRQSGQKLQAIISTGTGDPTNIPTVFLRQSRTDQSIPDISLKAGEYHLYVENFSVGGLNGYLKVSEYK